MSEKPMEGSLAPHDRVRVMVWSPYKPLEHELRKLIGLQAGMEAAEGPSNGTLASEISHADADIAVVNTDCSADRIADLISLIGESAPGIRIIALSAHRDRRMISRAFEAGAVGYVLTDCAFEDIPAALAAAIRNEQFVSPAIEESDESPLACRQNS